MNLDTAFSSRTEMAMPSLAWQVTLQVLLAASLLLLGACSSRPSPGLALAEPVTNTRTIEMFAATTRKPSDDAALRFGGERASRESYAQLTVSIPPNHQPGQVTWSTGGRPDAALAFAALDFRTIEMGKAREALRQRIRQTGWSHVLVFVHGYNTRFDEAAFRLAQIAYDSGAPVTPVLFSWPSWGSLASYPYDRESASISRDALENLLQTLIEEPSVKQVTLLAHSMGGWLTLETLRQMIVRRGTIAPKLGDVMLAAPDVDIDVAGFIGQTIQTARQKPKLTLFVSGDDRALSASRFLWGSRDRLGSIDADKEPYRSALKRQGVEVIDLTAIDTGSGLNHGKFAESPPVVQAIGRRLAAGQRLDGETAATESVGAVAQGTIRVLGDVLTAPVRVLGPAGP